MTEVVTVVKDKGKTAVVELKRTEKCAGCNKCSFNRRSTVKTLAIKDTDCATGDLVVVELPEKEILLAPLFLFVIPIACLLAGIVLGQKLALGWQLAVIAASLAVGLGILYAADRLYRRQRKFMPVITEKYEIEKNENQGENNND